MAVIFDMDGVIINSEDLHVRCEIEIFKRHGIYLTDDLINDMKGRTAYFIFEKYCQRTDLDPRVLLQEKADLFNQYSGDLKIFPGFFELIEFLPYDTGVATAATKEYQEWVFSRFGLNKYFKSVVNADCVKKSKPNPEPYILSLSQLGARPEECLVLEDSVNGMTAARNAGIQVCTVHGLDQGDYAAKDLYEVKRMFEEGMFDFVK